MCSTQLEILSKAKKYFQRKCLFLKKLYIELFFNVYIIRKPITLVLLRQSLNKLLNIFSHEIQNISKSINCRSFILYDLRALYKFTVNFDTYHKIKKYCAGNKNTKIITASQMQKIENQKHILVFGLKKVNLY
jgi:hypothetical protein